MCLAVPGKIISINENNDPLLKTGKVSFSGVVQEVSLAYVPEAKVGDYVIVHVGFALNTLDEEEANKIFELLKNTEEGQDLDLEAMR
ncbi:MAG: HypC/HybG/HupF family hydrogenase formation chaperone [Candidatus Omnitrophota bacterium]